MKALFIGGTGTISSEISKLCVKEGWDLYLLNRAKHSEFFPKGAKQIKIDDIHNESEVVKALKDFSFDVVVDFIAFNVDDIKRDVRLFKGRTKQFIFISSASAYQKPLASPVITESTPLYNPYWDYSQNKIECENYLYDEYRNNGFPITIIRPSHTYGISDIPVAVHGKNGSFEVVQRIKEGKPVIVQGDGTSIWVLTSNKDFAVAFCGIMGNTHAIGEVYQITSDELLTWNQIYNIIGNSLGVEPVIVHVPSETIAKLMPELSGGLLGDKAHSVIFDNTKIKKAVPEYNATIRFDQSVPKMLEYIYSHEECQKRDPEFAEWCDKLANSQSKLSI